MTLSAASTLRPALRPEHSPKANTAQPSSNPAQAPGAIDTFERIRPASTQGASPSQSPEMARLLEQVKAEKSAQNTNPVFPSTALGTQEFPVIHEKLTAESKMNLQPGK